MTIPTLTSIAEELAWKIVDLTFYSCGQLHVNDIKPDIKSALTTYGRQVIANWMIKRGLATGHGDTAEDMLEEAYKQIHEIGMAGSFTNTEG